MARRNYVVHTLEEGRPLQIVMSFTGHEDGDTLKPNTLLQRMSPQKLLDFNPIIVVVSSTNPCWFHGSINEMTRGNYHK